MIGVHYDTFPVIVIDKDEVTEKFIKAGINIKLPKIGKTIDL